MINPFTPKTHKTLPSLPQSHLSPSVQPIADLQSHLLNLWTLYSVDETYQNLFLVYIETFTNRKQQIKEIQSEIKKTYQKNSLYFLLQENILLRSQIKHQLQQQLQHQMKNSTNKKSSQKQQQTLKQLCDKLKNLRRINLLIAENILKIFEDFKVTRQSSLGSVGKKYIEIFMKIDVENEFIKQSFLNEFILFQKGYDPFFLVHYEEIMKSSNPNTLKNHQPVSELFNMNISYVYRLMRAQQKMLKYMLLIDDHTENEKERKEIINRQRMMKINSNKNENKQRSQPVSRHSNIFLPVISSKHDRNTITENSSAASTIKPIIPIKPRRPYQMRNSEDKNRAEQSQYGQYVKKKAFSLRPLDSERFSNQAQDDGRLQYISPKNQQRNHSLHVLKNSSIYLDTYNSANSKNFETEDEPVFRYRPNQRYSDNKKQIEQDNFQKHNKLPFENTQQQKKWNLKQALKDRRNYLRPIKTKQKPQDNIIEERQNQNSDQQTYFLGKNSLDSDYPMQSSLKKSKLADSENDQKSKIKPYHPKFNAKQIKQKKRQKLKQKDKSIKQQNQSDQEEEKNSFRVKKSKKSKNKQSSESQSRDRKEKNKLKTKQKNKQNYIEKKKKKIDKKNKRQQSQSDSQKIYIKKKNQLSKSLSKSSNSSNFSSQRDKNRIKKKKKIQNKEILISQSSLTESEQSDQSQKSNSIRSQNSQHSLQNDNGNKRKAKKKQQDRRDNKQQIQQKKIKQNDPMTKKNIKKKVEQSSQQEEEKQKSKNKEKQKLNNKNKNKDQLVSLANQKPRQSTKKNAGKTQQIQKYSKTDQKQKMKSKSKQQNSKKNNSIIKNIKGQLLNQNKQFDKQKFFQSQILKQKPNQNVQTQQQKKQVNNGDQNYKHSTLNDNRKSIPQQKKNTEPNTKKTQVLESKKQKVDALGNKQQKINNQVLKNNQQQSIKPAQVASQRFKNDKPNMQDNNNNKNLNNNKTPQQTLALNNSLAKEKPTLNNQSKQNQQQKIKIIPGKINFQQFPQYIKSKQIHPAYKQKFNSSLEFILKSAQKTQTYLNQFHLNDQLAVIALCSPTSFGNIVIYVWAPIEKVCDEKQSLFFFKKYLDYLENQTTFKSIMYCGQEIPQLKSQKFQYQKEKNYSRKRINKVKRQDFQFQYFFSIQATNLSFAQSSTQSLLYSDEITPFSQSNSWCNPLLLIAKNDQIPNCLQNQWKTDESIKSINQANQLLEKDTYDTFQVGEEKIKFQNINMARCMLSQVPKLGFIANQGYMIVAGKTLTLGESNKKISKIQLLNDINLYFGNDFKTVEQMARTLQKYRQKSKQEDNKFAFKMFSKQLYGKYLVKDGNLQIGKAFYSNWDLNFAWRDQIPGKIVHDVDSVKFKYGHESFMLVVEMKGQMVLGVEILKQDFLI